MTYCSYEKIVSNTADHARIRRLLSHAFSTAALQEQETLLARYFTLLIRKLEECINGPTQGVVDLTKWYNFTTFDIVGDLCLGEPFGTLTNGEYHAWISNIFKGLKFVVLIRFAQAYSLVDIFLKLLFAMVPEIAEAQRSHVNFTAERTRKRLAADTQRKDFITYILRYNNEKGMSREEIEGTCAVLLMAGSETTASFLCGATYYILSLPLVYERLREELQSRFKAEKDITLISLHALPYLDRVIKESLRVYPPTPSTIPRRTRLEGDIITGYFVPGDTSVGVHHWSASHSSRNFTDPEVFDPDRWLDPPPEKYRHDRRDASQPFSTGPRNCLGKNLAYFQMRSILARMLFSFDMQLCKESQNWATDQKTYILWDKPPLLVKLSHRNT